MDRRTDRVLATVLFTDIVGATKLAAEIGDRKWTELLGHHHSIVRQLIERHRGREIDTAGDGFVAAFDGPGEGRSMRQSDCKCGQRPRYQDFVGGSGLQFESRGAHTLKGVPGEWSLFAAV